VIPPQAVADAGGEEAARQRHAEFGKRSIRGLSLTDYLQSAAAIICGEAVSRRDVIRYVANKLGGAHFDPDRSRRGDERLALLDYDVASIAPERASGLNNVSAELLSVAQSLGTSGDAAR
jgi:hypothetical protein